MTISDKGDVFGWGNSEYSQLLQDEVLQINTPRHLGKFRGLGKITDVAAGGSFCIAANGRFDRVSEPQYINVVVNYTICPLIFRSRFISLHSFSVPQCNVAIFKYHIIVLCATLTLRQLMSYIYMEHPFLMFLDHTQRRSTVGRTPLDE